jgi:hypothetical protein
MKQTSQCHKQFPVFYYNNAIGRGFFPPTAARYRFENRPVPRFKNATPGRRPAKNTIYSFKHVRLPLAICGGTLRLRYVRASVIDTRWRKARVRAKGQESAIGTSSFGICHLSPPPLRT